MKLLSVVLVFLSAIAYSQAQNCPNGKLFQECGTPCPLTCDNHQNPPLFCLTSCVRGCFCPPGLVESGETCVAPEDCQGATIATLPPSSTTTPTCPNGMVFSECPNPCPLTCEYPEPRFCRAACRRGCHCPNGLLEHNGACITVAECPSTLPPPSPVTALPRTTLPPPPPPPTSPTCANGMIYNTCGTRCPLTCEFPNPRPCVLICEAGCFCPQGMLESNGACVAPENCPNTATTTVSTPATQPPPPPTNITCANGMIYNQCGTRCPLTCEYPDPRPCVRICERGCFCPQGLLEYNGGCVAREDCPSTTTTTTALPLTTVPPPPPTTPTCANGMIYNTCGTRCPLTCEFPDPRPCVRICEMGCFCPQGLLEYNGGCVAREDCPSTTTTTTALPLTTVPPPPPTTPTCANGMIYNTCGTRCPLTCEYPDPRPCVRICERGCFCPQGLLEYNGGCVAREDCPANICSLPSQTGLCLAAFRRYFYNATSRRCEMFIYGGCGGNENNFETLSDCESRCGAPPTAAVTEVSTPAAPVCANNMIYETCGTACPRTCQNRNDPPAPCPAICVQGCFCPPGMFAYNSACYTAETCPVAPNTPTCGNQMTYSRCGTPCPLTCEQPDPRPCPFTCSEGCFCPEGLLENNGRCVTREECPPPPCSNGMIYQSCGSYCPITCANVHNPPLICPLVCSAGCFCPSGMVEHEGRCYTPDQCPTITAAPTTALTESPMTCRNGMEYRECGPLCPPTCLGFNGCFSLRCAAGCFCPQGQFEHEGGCVEECPTATTRHPTQPTRPPVDPCALIDCAPGAYCLATATGRGRCVNNTCAINNGRCRDDQVCEMAVSGCRPDDNYCYRYPQCRDPPYVPCGSDAFLACDSEWTYCLQQNKTRRAECVSSCLSRNGNCDEDSVCITTPGDSPRLRCVESEDLPKDCPAGQRMDQCGNLCQLTCQQHLTGLPQACPAVCGPPACSCPAGLALFRDRCVEPKLCYILVNYPPAIKPLPIVEPNTVLLSLQGDRMDRDMFMRNRQGLLESIERALSEEGHDVVATIHGVHFDDDQMQIVVELTGSDITSESADVLAQALRASSHQLTIPIEDIDGVDVDYVESEAQGLSQTAIIAIAVSSGVAGVAVVVAWIAVMVCCCVISAKRNSTSPSSAPPEYKNQNYEFNDYSVPQKVKDPEKGKMIKEGMENTVLY